MKLIAGLGNPGKEYENTRHNMGFMVIDKFLANHNLSLDQSKFSGQFTTFNHNGEKIIVCKPMTYMNASGQCIAPLLNYYHMNCEDLLVVHDDLALPLGKLRLRFKGSSGGQKGMGNIIQLLNSQDIKRIRIGIGENVNIDSKDYVLSKFSKQDHEVLDPAIAMAAEALDYWLDHDFQQVMNKFNS